MSVERIRKDFEALALSKNMSIEKRNHMVGIEYYVAESTMFMWTGYLAGRQHSPVPKRYQPTDFDRRIDEMNLS